jgi:hypothetical protein
MKFCPVVSEICRGHVHVARKERIIIIIIKKIIRRRNGAKTISPQMLFGRLNKPCECRSADYRADGTLGE